MHAPEAGLEEADERQAQQAQFDAIDPHPTMLSQLLVPRPSCSSAQQAAIRAAILAATLDFRYIAIEGPLGVGKSALADQLGARFDATVVLDETDNPFLADFYAERPGSGFQAQLFYTLGRHRQQTSLRQRDLFSQLTICDYLFERDKIYAYLNLDDNELFIYQRLYELLAPDLLTPDLVDLPAGPDRRPAPPAARAAAQRRRPAHPRGPLRPRAERGLQPLLLPLLRFAAPRRRNVAVRPDVGRGRRRRHRAPDTRDGEGHEILRADGRDSRQSTVASRRCSHSMVIYPLIQWPGSRSNESPLSRPTSRAGFPRGSGSNARPAGRSSTTKTSSRA